MPMDILVTAMTYWSGRCAVMMNLRFFGLSKLSSFRLKFIFDPEDR